MKLYVVKLTRLRDRLVQHPVGATRIELAEESMKDIVATFAKRCKEELKPVGSRTWRNSFVEVSLEMKKAPFKLRWAREEWAAEKL
jgi:hypothetical protein